MTLGPVGTDSERRSKRGSRRLRLALLVVGFLGLVIGTCFLVASFLRVNPRLRMFGIVYVLGSLVAFGLRGIVAEVRRSRRRVSNVNGGSLGKSS